MVNKPDTLKLTISNICLAEGIDGTIYSMATLIVSMIPIVFVFGLVVGWKNEG